MAKWQVKQKLDNPIVIQKLEEAFALDCTIWEACFYAEIVPQTYYNLISSKPELLDRFTALRNNPVLLARQELVKGLVDNPELALKYLERKRKDEFSTKQETWFTDKEWKDVIPKVEVTIKTSESNWTIIE